MHLLKALSVTIHPWNAFSKPIHPPQGGAQLVSNRVHFSQAPTYSPSVRSLYGLRIISPMEYSLDQGEKSLFVESLTRRTLTFQPY